MTEDKPNWFDEPHDWVRDQQAWQAIKVPSPQLEQRQLHRAARHQNWHQAPSTVKTWTGQNQANASAQCQQNFWRDIAPVASPPARRFVTHRKFQTMPDEVKQKLSGHLQNTAYLLTCLRDWHVKERNDKPNKPLWLGSKEQLDSHYPLESKNLHRLLAALGLWHFGAVPAGQDGAVLRLEYEIDDQVPLFKPDWRHGYPAFYWSAASTTYPHGLTRDLSTGQPNCQEWVTALSELDPLLHLVDVQCVLPAEAHNHYELPATYWAALQAEIEITTTQGDAS